jgi:hypothetical protein
MYKNVRPAQGKSKHTNVGCTVGDNSKIENNECKVDNSIALFVLDNCKISYFVIRWM